MRAHEARNTKQNPRHHNSWGGLNACDVVLIANLLGVHSALIKSLLENFDTSLTSLIFLLKSTVSSKGSGQLSFISTYARAADVSTRYVNN